MEALILHPDCFPRHYLEEIFRPLEDIQRQLANEIVLGAWIKDELVGIVGFVAKRVPKLFPGGTIKNLYLKERFRRKGVQDIERNVPPDIVILERRGIFRGREGTRELARLLEEELPKAPYGYTNRLVAGRVAFLEWTAEGEHARVRDGADSFVIEDGWIVAQTIHYTVEKK